MAISSNSPLKQIPLIVVDIKKKGISEAVLSVCAESFVIVNSVVIMERCYGDSAGVSTKRWHSSNHDPPTYCLQYVKHA